MTQIKKYKWLVVCFACLQIGCNPGQKEKSYDDGLAMSKWACHTLSDDEICLPKDWNPIEQDKAYYFAYLDNNDKQTYFAIVRYDILKDNVSAEWYLKEMLNQLINGDDRESFEGYTLNELKFIDKVSYYGEYYTQIDDEQYFTYSMVVEYKGNLYEIALKVLRGKGPDYKDVFQKILTHFKINNNTIFNKSDEIIEEKLLKLHD